MEKEKKNHNKSGKVLSQKSRKKLDESQGKFFNDNKGFFEFLQKFTPKDFQECINKYCAQSYLEFLKDYDAKVYNRFISDESIGEYYKSSKNPFDGMNPEEFKTIFKALEKSMDFYGKGGRLSKRSIIIYTKTFKKYDAEKNAHKKPKWSEVFRWVTQNKNERGNILISDHQDRETQKGTFLKFRKRNNLHTLADFLNYLKKNDYPVDSR